VKFKAGETTGDFPDPAIDAAPSSGRQSIVLAGGCFWCTEAVFQQIAGVEKVYSGYAGGSAEDAQYDVVCSGRTDHAEAIQVVYDASKVTLGQLLKVFFAVAHDPTQLNHQGPDWGRQYRSAIFYADEEQKTVAEAYIAQLNGAKVFPKKIVTEVAPLNAFYEAETYHQNYVNRNPHNPYIMMNAIPKVEKARQYFPELTASGD